MLLEQRLEAIYRLDIRMAHLRIARWLHIHKLYEALARDVGGRDIEDFVIVTVWIRTRPWKDIGHRLTAAIFGSLRRLVSLDGWEDMPVVRLVEVTVDLRRTNT